MLILFGLCLPEDIHAAGKDTTGLSSEEISSMRNFREQTEESIGKAKKNKELNKAKRELEDILALVKKKISIYEDKAKTLISEEKKYGAKVYSREASFLNRIAVKISKSLKDIEKREIASKIEQSKKFLADGDIDTAEAKLQEILKSDPSNRNAQRYLAKIKELRQEKLEQELASRIDNKIEEGKRNLKIGKFEEAEFNFKEALNLLPEKETRKNREIESLLTSIPSLKEKQKREQLEEKSASYTTEGFEYLKAGRTDEAETSFNKALEIFPDNRSAKNGLARIQQERDRMHANRISMLLKEARSDIRKESFETAKNKLNEILEIEPENRYAKRYLTEIEKLKQTKEREYLLARVENKIEQGETKLEAGEFEAAKTNLQEALELLPDEEKKEKRRVELLLASIPNLMKEYQSKQKEQKSDYYTDRGFEYLKSGRIDEAKNSFNKALEIFPENRKARSGLTRIEREQRRKYANRISNLLSEARSDIRANSFDIAEKKLEEVLKLEPENRQAQRYLAKIKELRQEKLEQELASRIDNKIEEGKRNLKIGKFEEAEFNFKEALNLLPEKETRKNREIESLLTSIPALKRKYQEKADYRKIEEIVAEAREHEKERQLDDLIQQGRDYLIDNNFTEAKRKFLEASKIEPENELVLNCLAEVEQAKEKYEQNQILKRVEKIIAEGKKYLEAEQLDKAESTFKRAFKISPSEDKKIEIQSLLDNVDKTRQTIYNKKLQEQADEYIAKGVEDLQKKQYAKARANFDKALTIKPDYSEAKEWLVKLDKTQEETRQNKLQAMIMEGKKYLKNNQFDAAGARFTKVLEIDPTHSEALYYLNMLGKAEVEYKNRQQFEKIKVVVDNGMKYLEEGSFDKAESIFKDAVEMAPINMREQVTKIIEEEVSYFLHEGESKQKADKYISEGIKHLDNNEFDKAEELFDMALNIVPGYERGEEYLLRLKTARLKYESSHLLEQIDSTIEKSDEELEKIELGNPVADQLAEEIRSKIEESKKILKGRIE